VWKVPVVAGDRVQCGDPLVIVESMKMEISITRRCGTGAEGVCREGNAVAAGQEVVVMEGELREALLSLGPRRDLLIASYAGWSLSVDNAQPPSYGKDCALIGLLVEITRCASRNDWGKVRPRRRRGPV
jgi:pyruvate/2-oxoglutarate dehydrogenase complex dihydrolipoamide acyltransferase (E2) component